MLHIGCHLSISKGFEHIAKEAVSISADTFQFFTRNPQGGKAKDLDLKDIEQYRSYAATHHFAPIVAHAPYTLNPCSDNPQTREFAEMVFTDDLRRMEHVPNNYYNFHPGSHVGQGSAQGVAMIIDLLNKILSPMQTTTVLLETMSGKGSEVGATFEELAQIIAGVNLKEKMGVCLDTCHVFAAGYDIVNQLDDVLEKFDKIIGLERLKAVHLNDSLMPFASHKDRHAKIGEGLIGAEALVRFINHPSIKNLPLILETPNEIDGYAKEIEFLRHQAI
ncbi:MAG: deoxyribonuclease IV [Alphaproteobacteria bacterium]|nr:deoxyribonuclease IV [Alphaproteobacteria bacterium]